MRLGGPVFLCYHGVNRVDPADDPVRLVADPEHVEAHIALLQGLGYRFLTAEALLDAFGGSRPRGRVAVLTFDDGWQDALDVVAPLLDRLRVPGTFYVCPGWFGGQHPNVTGDAGRLLDAAGARELHERGFEVAAHTMTHPDLRALDDAELARELGESRASVEAITGRPGRTFAYPFGLYDDRVVRATEATGFELAFAWEPRRWSSLAVPRLPAPPRHGRRRLALKLLGLRLPDRVWARLRS